MLWYFLKQSLLSLEPWHLGRGGKVCFTMTWARVFHILCRVWQSDCRHGPGTLHLVTQKKICWLSCQGAQVRVQGTVSGQDLHLSDSTLPLCSQKTFSMWCQRRAAPRPLLSHCLRLSPAAACSRTGGAGPTGPSPRSSVQGSRAPGTAEGELNLSPKYT